MATIHREACFYTGEPSYKGKGWAVIPIWWVISPIKEFTMPFISYGRLKMRIIGWQEPDNLYVVEADNWRWPTWWVLLRLWRFLCWFERNLRLTAEIWGLLKCELGVMPRWRDFVLLWWIRKRKNEAFIRQGLDEISKKLEESA